MSTSTNLPERKLYRPPLGIRIFTTFWFSGVLIGVFRTLYQFLNQSSQSNSGVSSLGILYMFSLFVFFDCVFVAIGFCLFAITNFTQLILSPEGIEYRGLGFSVCARWEDTSHIWRPPSVIGNPAHFTIADGLVVQRSKVQAPKWLAPIIRWGSWHRIIPIGQFAWNWPTSDLGNEIFLHIPTLDRRKY